MPEEKHPKKGLGKWGVLIVLSLALAIIIIDTTILNVSIATIIREFNTDIQSLQWVITAYSLTLAALTITGGRLGDIFGRKKMFILGAILFGLGSLLCSYSNSIPMMIAGESIIEGVGAALMMPATASLLVSTFKGKERAIAFGVWGGIAGAASALGPILGGYLTTEYSWRWGFRVNVIVVLLLLLGSKLIPESKDTEEKPQLDLIGSILSGFGLLGVVFGIIESSRYGWWKAKETFSAFGKEFTFLGDYSIVPLSLVLGLIVLILFFLWERKVEQDGNTPLVSLGIFKNQQFVSGTTTTALMALGQSGMIFAIPVFLQSVRGLSAYETGRALLPLSLTALLTAPLTGFLSHKVRAKYLILTGITLNLVGVFVLRNALSVDATATTLIPGLILFGLGMGTVMAQLGNLTLSAVSVQEAGEASGINNTMRQVGATFGSAVIGAIMLTALTNNLSSGVQASTVIDPRVKDQVAEAVRTQTSNVEFGGGAHLSTDLPISVTNEIRRISQQATVDANRETMLYGAFFAFLGLLSAFWLPSVKNVEKEQSAAAHPHKAQAG